MARWGPGCTRPWWRSLDDPRSAGRPTANPRFASPSPDPDCFLQMIRLVRFPPRNALNHLPAGRWAAIPTALCRVRPEASSGARRFVSLFWVPVRSHLRDDPMATWRQCETASAAAAFIHHRAQHDHKSCENNHSGSVPLVAVSMPDSIRSSIPCPSCKAAASPPARCCRWGGAFSVVPWDITLCRPGHAQSRSNLVRLSSSDPSRYATRTPTSDVPTPPGVLSKWIPTSDAPLQRRVARRPEYFY